MASSNRPKWIRSAKSVLTRPRAAWLSAAGAGLLAVGGLLTGGSTTSCGDEQRVNPPGDAGVIRIGLLGSLTGDQASTSKTLVNSARVAEQQLNSLGGILGQRVVIAVVDDATDKKQTVQLSNQFVQEGISAVLGPSSSGGVTATQDIFFQAKTIQISATATSPDLTALQPLTDRYLFRTIAPNDRMAKVLARFAALHTSGPSDAGVDSAPPPDASGDGGMSDAAPPPTDGATPPRGCKRMGIIHQDDSFGNAFAAGMRESFEAYGGVVPLDVVVPDVLKADYRTEIQQVFDVQPVVDCMAMLVFGNITAQMMRNFNELKALDTTHDFSRFFVVASNSAFSKTFVVEGRADPADPASPTSAEGVFGVYVDPTPDTREYADFQNMYTSMFDIDTSDPVNLRSTANQYDATILIALAIQQAGGYDDRVKLRDALYAISQGGRAYGPAEVGEAIAAIKRGDDVDYSGASGAVDFAPDGTVQEDFIVWVVENGTFKIIERVRAADAQ